MGIAREGMLVADRYRLVRRLDPPGRAGPRWLARDGDIGEDVALTQCVPPSSGPGVPDTGALVTAVRAEIARLAGLWAAAPRAVTVHDCVEHEGAAWVVAARPEGTTGLGQRAGTDAGLPVAEVARVGLAVLDVLEAGHFLGVVHQALTPSAVLFAADEDAVGEDAADEDAARPDGTGVSSGRVLLADFEPGIVARAWRAAGGNAEEYPEPGDGLQFQAPERLRDPAAPAAPAGDLFSLAATLHAAAEGRGPFEGRDAPETRELLLGDRPAAPSRHKELDPLLRRLLTKEPETRASTDEARRGLTRVRDAAAAETSGTADGGGGEAGSPAQHDAGGAPSRRRLPWHGPKEAPGGSGRRRRVKALWLTGAAVAAGALLAGGLWLASDRGDGKSADGPSGSPEAEPAPMASSSGGARHPYGKGTGLTEALTMGDCLNVVWPGAALKGRPAMGLTDCEEEGRINAQVVATVHFEDAATARRDGAEACAGQGGKVARSLPDAGTYAVVPTGRGFSAAGGDVACLVAAKHSYFFGELGRFRDSGSELALSQMSRGDCVTYVEKKKPEDARVELAASCSRSHTDQVVGFVDAPDGTAYEDLTDDKVGDLCSNRYESRYPVDEDTYIWGYTIDKEGWNEGFRKLVCTIGPADGRTSTEYEPTGAEGAAT